MMAGTMLDWDGQDPVVVKVLSMFEIIISLQDSQLDGWQTLILDDAIQVNWIILGHNRCTPASIFIDIPELAHEAGVVFQKSKDLPSLVHSDL